MDNPILAKSSLNQKLVPLKCDNNGILDIRISSSAVSLTEASKTILSVTKLANDTVFTNLETNNETELINLLESKNLVICGNATSGTGKLNIIGYLNDNAQSNSNRIGMVPIDIPLSTCPDTTDLKKYFYQSYNNVGFKYIRLLSDGQISNPSITVIYW